MTDPLNITSPATAPTAEFHADGYAQSFEDYPGLSLPLIKDLSPAINFFGRRGETYVTQLTALKTILDQHYENAGERPAVINDMEEFANKHDPDKYPRFGTVDRQAVEEGRPLMPFMFLTPRYMTSMDVPAPADSLINTVIYHQCFDRILGTYPDYQVLAFLNAFTHHTLYRDLLNQWRENLQLDKSYAAYCERWGIPA